jgi:hypothetical protein
MTRNVEQTGFFDPISDDAGPRNKARFSLGRRKPPGRTESICGQIDIRLSSSFDAGEEVRQETPLSVLLQFEAAGRPVLSESDILLFRHSSVTPCEA